MVLVGTLRGVVTQILLESDTIDPNPLAIELRRSIITPLLHETIRERELTGGSVTVHETRR